jgi:hypothetical protein
VNANVKATAATAVFAGYLVLIYVYPELALAILAGGCVVGFVCCAWNGFKSYFDGE